MHKQACCNKAIITLKIPGKKCVKDFGNLAISFFTTLAFSKSLMILERWDITFVTTSSSSSGNSSFAWYCIVDSEESGLNITSGQKWYSLFTCDRKKKCKKKRKSTHEISPNRCHFAVFMLIMKCIQVEKCPSKWIFKCRTNITSMSNVDLIY